MRCPICNDPLISLVEDGFICPNDDGVLITNRHLMDKDTALKNVLEKEETETHSATSKRNTELTCPHCNAAMSRVDYNSTDITIDSCPSCHYRWLDKGEFAKIVEYKPQIDAQDLLYLVDLEEKTAALTQKSTSDPNPEVPLSSGIIGGLIKGSAAGNSSRALTYMMGAGMYGLIAGSIKSKHIRIIAPFIVIVFVLLGYLILKQMQLIDWRPLRR